VTGKAKFKIPELHRKFLTMDLIESNRHGASVVRNYLCQQLWAELCSNF